MASVSVLRLSKRAPAGVSGIRRAKRKTETLHLPGKYALVGSIVMCLSCLIFFNLTLAKKESSLATIEDLTRKLKLENHRLMEEWTQLKSPARMGYVAQNQLGLKHPTEAQVIVMK